MVQHRTPCLSDADTLAQLAQRSRLQDMRFPEIETDPRILARCTVRAVFRAVQALPQPQSSVVIFGSNHPKHSLIAQSLSKYGVKVVVLSPRAITLGADKILDMLDEYGHTPLYFIALVDGAVPLTELLNCRLNQPSNNPDTWALRRDKFEQQDALRCHGIDGAADQIVTSDEEVAIRFASNFEEVVIKPRDSSAGDGTWVCRNAADIRKAFAAELGKSNLEGSRNHVLVVMECFHGEEWVINTVSLDGTHKISDIWRGPAKTRCRGAAGDQFAYDQQFLVAKCPEVLRIAEYTFQVLDVMGVCNGAAHTEVVWSGNACDAPRLCEVNPRCAGGMPRTPHYPNQLELLNMSMHDPVSFRSKVPDVAETADVSAAVVFLHAPCDGWLPVASLEAFASLETFAWFDRGLQKQKGALRPHPVHRTTGLCSAPGTIVLHGSAEDVRLDAARIRNIETVAYSDQPEPSEEFRQKLLRLFESAHDIDEERAPDLQCEDVRAKDAGNDAFLHASRNRRVGYV